MDFVDDPSEKSDLTYNLNCYLAWILFSCGVNKALMRPVMVMISNEYLNMIVVGDDGCSNKMINDDDVYYGSISFLLTGRCR